MDCMPGTQFESSRPHHAVVFYRRFPEGVRKAPSWRGSVRRFVLRDGIVTVGRSFLRIFSGPEIPFPGNGDRERQRLGSNAGYAEGSPSIWCCRDHSAGMSARRATPCHEAAAPSRQRLSSKGELLRRKPKHLVLAG